MSSASVLHPTSYYNKPKRKIVHEQSPTSTTSSPSLGSTFKESLVSGIGGGIGMNIADRLISSVFGNRSVNVVHKHPECEDIGKMYAQMKENGTLTDSMKEAFEKCSKQQN